MERLWFIDKKTGERATVSAERLGDGRLGFSYQGRRYTFSERLLGERIFACSDEVREERPDEVREVRPDEAQEETNPAEMPEEECDAQVREVCPAETREEMHPAETPEEEEIFYQGEYFRREAGKWTASDGSIPKEKYQRRLSQAYVARGIYDGYSARELIEFARGQVRDAAGCNAAIRALEIAFLKAGAGEARRLLPILSSFYRRAGAPSASLRLYDSAVEWYGSRIETAAFLTSLSAAYMDTGNIRAAERVKEKAFTLGDGEDEMLDAFARRFDAETRIE